MCVNGVLRTIGSKEKCCIKHFRTNCGGWNCSDCRPMLEALWVETVEMHWSSHRQIGFSIIEVEKFPALRKKIKRNGGNYIRISAGDRLFYVFTDVLSASDSEMSIGESIEKFKWCLQNAPCPKTKRYAGNDSEFRVVSTSGGWRQLHRSETFPEYELIGNGIPTEVVADTLAEMGKTVDVVVLGKANPMSAMCAKLDTPAEYEQFKQKVRAARRSRPRSPINGNTGIKGEPLYLRGSRDACVDTGTKKLNAGDERLSRRAFNDLRFAMGK